MKKIFLSEIALSELLEQISEVVQTTVQSEMKSIIGSAKKSQPSTYLTKQEVCAKFGISASSVYRHVNSGVIDCFKIGRRSLFVEQQVMNSLIKLNTRKGGNYEF